MKSLNLTFRSILLTLVFVSTTNTAIAYDFVVKGIYYNINGDEASVTYKGQNYTIGNTTYPFYNDNSGEVIIPETVTYNGKTYTVTSYHGGGGTYSSVVRPVIVLPTSAISN